jgi:hypothetical protein
LITRIQFFNFSCSSRYWWTFQAVLWTQSRQEVPPLDSTQGVGAARGAVLVALLATAVLVLAPFPAVLIYR